MDNHGIEGSKTKKTYVRKKVGNTKYHYIDYSDLTRDIFKTKRNTNPLDPIYGFKKNEDIFKYGPIEKSKPQTYYPFFYQPVLNLKLDDIKGTNIGSKNKITKFNGNNYELITHDIEGCGVGSLKKGIVTKRCTNPLAPEYQYLGAKEFQGSKFGEYSKNKRAKSVANSNNTSVNNIENNIENVERVKSPNSNINEPKMVSINDIDKQSNNNNIKYEEQKNENNLSEVDYGKEIPNNDNIEFDRNYFGKKPDPNFGLSHDPYVQSSDNPEKLKEIEKMKKLQFTMSKTSSSGFFSGKNKNNGMSQFQNNPNLSNFNQKTNKNNSKLNYGGSTIANNLGGVGSLNIDGNINGNDIRTNEIKKMNKTSFGFRPSKKTYEEKLDNFMANHNLKFVEQQKKSIQDEIYLSNKGKTNNVKKTPDNINTKNSNKKK